MFEKFDVCIFSLVVYT